MSQYEIHTPLQLTPTPPPTPPMVILNEAVPLASQLILDPRIHIW